MSACNFDRAWIGKCKNETPCKDHDGLRCKVCGNKATHDCPETSAFVCGTPLCDECVHDWGGYSHHHDPSRRKPTQEQQE